MLNRTRAKTLVCLTTLGIFVSVAHAGTPTGSAFNYQAQLKQNGAPYNGTVDLSFSLFDSTDTQVGGPLTRPQVDVTNGLFSVDLDFGTGAFQGLALFLEVSVRAPSDPTDQAPYATLSPRQELDATPFAISALQARSASDLALPIAATTDQGGTGLSVVAAPAASDATAIRGESQAGGGNSVGVEGIASGSTGPVIGVHGSAVNSTDGTGVFGESLVASGPTRGVWGRAASPDGHAGYFDGRGYFSDRVGIGTETPEAELDVIGMMKADTLWLTNGAAAGRLLECVDATGTAQWVDPPTTGTGHSLDALDGSPTNAVFVDADGNVGVGTTAPAADLHVRGKTPLGKVIITPGVSDSSSEILMTENQTASLGAIMRYDGTSNEWQILGQSRDAQSLPIEVGPHLTVGRDNGRVGIGTASPEARLHVFDGSAGAITANGNAPLVVESDHNAYLDILTPDANESGVLFGRPGSSAPNAAGGVVFNSAGTDALDFRTGGNKTRMTIDSGGNVGIGTTTPGTSLHVVDSGTARIRVESTSGQAGISFMSDSSVENVVYSPQGSDDLRIHVNGADRLSITSSGNVGVGTTSPSERLVVSGNVAVTGEVRRTATGSANMVPICYGHIHANGSIASGSGNFTVTLDSNNNYRIAVTGEDFGVRADGYTVLVTPMNSGGGLNPTTTTVSGNLIIYLEDGLGFKVQHEFAFVVYKP